MRPGGEGGRPVLLVLRALGLGDLLTAVPALRALRRAHPDHRVVLAGPSALAPLAALTGAVDEVVEAAPLAALPPEVHGADLAVNLHGRGPESSARLVATRPGRLVAFAHPDVPETAGGPRWRCEEHEVDRWCRLVTAAGASGDRTDLLLPRPAGPPTEAVGAVVVHPGAASPARRWPVDRWGAVVTALVAEGHRVVLTGTGAEVELATAVATAATAAAGAAPSQPGAVRLVAGRTGPLELLRLVADARLVLCGDTGVAHLATAAATPSVVLFGPTPPAWWGPVSGGPHTVLWAGRQGDPHASEPDPGLLELTVADVLAAARSRLDADLARR